MTNASRFGEMHRVCQRTDRSPCCGNDWFVLGWQAERAFSRSRCQGANAVFPVACPFCGTQEEREARERAVELSEVKVKCGL